MDIKYGVLCYSTKILDRVESLRGLSWCFQLAKGHGIVVAGFSYDEDAVDMEEVIEQVLVWSEVEDTGVSSAVGLDEVNMLHVQIKHLNELIEQYKHFVQAVKQYLEIH